MSDTVEESVVLSLDGTNSKLFPFLPYILQDIWEIGTSPETVLKLIKAHTTNYSNLRILDLGCGKGAVSVTVSKELKCQCYGIDAIEEFIEEARDKAREFNIEEYCHFECGDIRIKIHEIGSYDIIILGAIGPVLGDYYSTLTQLSNCLNEGGLVIIDDGYIDHESEYSHPSYRKKSVLLNGISDAGMTVIDEIVMENDAIKEADDIIYKGIRHRCQELIKIHPDQKSLFDDYIKQQEEENETLETEIICSTMLLSRCV